MPLPQQHSMWDQHKHSTRTRHSTFPSSMGKELQVYGTIREGTAPSHHPSLLSSQLLGSDRNNSSKILTGEGKPGITNPEQ